MDIKSFLYKKKEEKAKNIRIIATAIIICLFIMGIIILNQNQYTQNTEHFIWEKISVFWTISYDNNYPTNTHKISNAWENFGLKDSTINLNNLLDINAEINWNISEITKKYPILTISTIKIPSYKLSISDNKYFYTKDLISFDFSKDIDVYSKKIWWKIIVYYQNEPILQVETFLCNNINENQNCEKMKMNYIINLTETFESTLWYTFYKDKENSRVTFNDNNIWYNFKVNSDNDMINLSHLINIINSNFFRIYKKDLLLSWCSNDKIDLKEIISVEKWIIDDELIRLSIKWKTSEWKFANCKLNINIFNNRNIVNSSISFSE